MDVTQQMQRLEPFRRFLVLVILGHLTLGGIVWWWIQYKRMSAPTAVDTQSLSWMVPADITTKVKPVEEPLMKAAPPIPKNPLPQVSAPIVSQNAAPIVIQAAPPPPAAPMPAPPKVEAAPPPVAKEPAAEVKPVPKAIPWPKDKPPPGAASMAAPVPVPAPASTSSAPGNDGVTRFISVSRKKADVQSVPGLDAVDSSVRDSFLGVWNAPKADGIAAEQRSLFLDVTIGGGGQLLSFKCITQPADESLKASVLDAANRLTKISKPLPVQYRSERYSVQVHFHVD